MTADTQLNQLWSGVVSELRLDLAAHRSQVIISVTDSAITRRFLLAFDGLSMFTFTDADPGTWDYIELTSVRAEQVPAHKGTAWRFMMELWNSSLEVMCETWTLTQLE